MQNKTAKKFAPAPYTPLRLILELTIYGVILAVVLNVSYGRLDGHAVAAIVGFLASVFFYRMLFPVEPIPRYFWQRLGAMVGCGLCSWSLIYYAENTRSGWYRFHVLQHRVQQLVSKAPAYIVTIDCEGFITGTSDNIELLTGYAKSELLGNPATLLMRPGPAERHKEAMAKAVAILRDNRHSPDAGWTLQGIITVGIKHKDGHIVPVKAYAGGIRWSQDIQFQGDLDLFAIFVPVTEHEAREADSTTISPSTPIQAAPDPPAAPTLVPLPHRQQLIDKGDIPSMAEPGSGGKVINPQALPE